MNDILFMIACFVVGFWIGLIVSKYAKRPAGTLKIEHNEEKDLYLFEIDDLDKLSSKRQVILKVSHTRK